MGKATDGFTKIQKLLSKNLEIAMSKNTMEGIADIVVNNIRTRALIGKGVKGDKQYTFDRLSDKYIDQRKRYNYNLSPETSATQKKSNATATGQMLNSISKQVSAGFFRIFFKGNRGKELDGKRRGLSNEYVADKFQEKRPFFNVTKADINEIKRYVRSLILKK